MRIGRLTATPQPELLGSVESPVVEQTGHRDETLHAGVASRAGADGIS